ncbi:MAG: homoserine dehydrogenase, partial [Pseudomonadota bacterium]
MGSSEDQPIRIGVAGLGVVGARLLRLLVEDQDRFATRGARFEIAGVCARNRNRDRGVSLADYAWFDNPVELASRGEIDVFVELIGGADGPARAAVEAALKAGVDVVTANKALIAEHGAGLAKLAEEHEAALEFEAAVAGGIPAIRVARDALAPNRMTSVSGILNGTCNYILSQMETTGAAYGDVLAEAQRLGYAEADPSFDVGGIDAAHKLAILASLCFGTELNFGSVATEGIERVSPLDLKFAQELGYRIKLIGAAELDDRGAVRQSVRPVLLSLDHPLAPVGDVINAVVFEAEPVGTLFLSGPGAGAGPTAAAVAADLCDIASGDKR